MVTNVLFLVPQSAFEIIEKYNSAIKLIKDYNIGNAYDLKPIFDVCPIISNVTLKSNYREKNYWML